MRRQLTLLLVATQFLTRLPVPGSRDLPPDALADSARFFPIVGAFVGAGGVAIDWLIQQRAGRHVSVVLILIYFVTITGGLHEDALSDAADGFGGGWTKERTLAIMRDSHIGSFGAIAITCSILARFVFLTSLPQTAFHGVLVAGQVLARWAMVPLAYWLPSARDEDGQGARVARKTSSASLVIATLYMAGVVAIALARSGIVLIMVSIAVAALTGAYYRRRIGGITGDCLGATCHVTECAVYLTGVIS
jgi:adenosylcobinamide-GDP ribazoletransferase